MTTAANGTASMNRVLATNITISSRITTSVHSLDGLQAAQVLPAVPEPMPSIIVDGDITTIPDYPGFTALRPKRPGSAKQLDALRSAAKNTAAAYGLNETLSADRASVEQYSIQQQISRQQPTVVMTQVILPD